MSTFKSGAEINQLSLLKSAYLSEEVNYNLVHNTFYPMETIDIGGIDIDRLIVLIYGHRLTADNNYATIANQGTLAIIGSATLVATWELTSDQQLQVGFMNFGNETVTAPYTTVYISYFLFTY